MPVTVKAPEKPKPRNPVKTCGTQEMFQTAGDDLAKALGWHGEPDHEGNGIRVQDAWNFIVKSLHEAYIAGALGHAPRDPALVAEHLGLEDAADLALITKAMTKAYEDGEGQEVQEVEGKTVSLGAALVQSPGKAG